MIPRVLLIAYLIFFPLLLNENKPSKGVSGWVTPHQIEQLGVSWFHQWNLCSISGGKYLSPHECVSAVKDDTQYTKEQILSDLQSCESGWILFGDEWNIMPGWTIERQADALRWFADIVREGNPSCKIAFGGWLLHPGREYQDWLDIKDEYGEPLPISAVVVDIYRWSPDWTVMTKRMISDIRVEFPGLEVWAREIGCLTSHECAISAMEELPLITRNLDRWAWFISYGYPISNLYTPEDMTDLGLMYSTQN